MTEAGTPCGREPRACPKKCLHVRPPYAWAPALCFRRDKFREGLHPVPRFRGDRLAGSRVLPLCAAAFYGVSRRQLAAAAIGNAGIKRKEGHLVDALALRGDEGRGTLRKARGRCERSVIPGSPNGATPPAREITI